jgi:hypothetical protein
MKLLWSRYPELSWLACLLFGIATVFTLRHYKFSETVVIVSTGVVVIAIGLVLGGYLHRDRGRQ